MNTPTADICDAHESGQGQGELMVLRGQWRWFGQARSFSGPISTVETGGSNYHIRQALAESGAGRVLLIDAQGDERACIGENLALLARRNGWAGVVVRGNLRDASKLKDIALGIVALGTWPARTENSEGGRRDVPLLLENRPILPGDVVCADEDGVLILRHR